MSAARFAGWNPFTVLTWGFAPKASLHPRLYAFACFAGWDAHFVLKKDACSTEILPRKQELGGLLRRSQSQGQDSGSRILSFLPLPAAPAHFSGICVIGEVYGSNRCSHPLVHGVNQEKL